MYVYPGFLFFFVKLRMFSSLYISVRERNCFGKEKNRGKKNEEKKKCEKKRKKNAGNEQTPGRGRFQDKWS